MGSDTHQRVLADTGALLDNVRLRVAVIGAIDGICSGETDADYYEPPLGIPPTLGLCFNPRYLIDGMTAKTFTLRDIYRIDDAMYRYWTHVDAPNPWHAYTFRQTDGAAPYDCVGATHPFRGECAGALQLALLRGLAASLGADAVARLELAHGLLRIGGGATRRTARHRPRRC